MRAAGLAGAGGAVAVASAVVLTTALVVSPPAEGSPMGGARAGVVVGALGKTSSPARHPTKTTVPATKSSPTTSKPSSSAPPATPQRTDCQLEKQGSPASEIKTEPWAQQRLDFTSVWSLTQGQGVTVAVVDSGVDDRHPQLRGHITSFDATGTGAQDCVGHGTEVAGIIGAKDMRQQGVPFTGVAPGASLISVKMANQSTDNDPHFLANAIRKAVDEGAKVINVSSQTPDYDYLRSAVQYAQSKDALIVAAAGNVQNQQTGSTEPAYPANYPGVVSVGAIGQDGKLTDFSNILTKVELAAPGKDIISTWPNGTYSSDSGTSFASPYVAGVAALVRSYHPKLSAAQVLHRLEVTAEGGTAQGTGYGVVNPMQAVSAVLPEENSAPATSPALRRVAVAKPARPDTVTREVAFAVAGGTLSLALVVGLAGAIIPLGRRRGWRPGNNA